NVAGHSAGRQSPRRLNVTTSRTTQGGTVVRHTTRNRRLTGAAGLLLAGALVAPFGMNQASAHVRPAEVAQQPAQAAVEQTFSALVFSKTAAFRHGSIETGVATIEALGEANGFTVD